MALEAKNWPLGGVWTPKSVTEDVPRMPGLDSSSLQVDETKDEQETKTLDDLLSPYVSRKLHAIHLLLHAYILLPVLQRLHDINRACQVHAV